MPSVTFVKKARKAIPESGIAVGDSYYWWKFRYSGKISSKTRPKPSQLTQSEFYRAALSLQEQIEEMTTVDAETLEELVCNIREIGEECSSKLENMPEALQYSPVGELLQERVDAMEAWADEIEAIEISDPLAELQTICPEVP